TVFTEASDDELAIELVHLAADGFDVEFHGWRKSGRGGDGERGRRSYHRFSPSPYLPIFLYSLSRAAVLLIVVVRLASTLAVGFDLALDVGNQFVATALH